MVPNTHMPEMNTVLAKYRQNGIFSNASLKLSSVQFGGSSDGGAVKISAVSLNAVEIIAKNGNKNASANAITPTSRQPVSQYERSRLRVRGRSEEHTSELQSRGHLVCRLL